MVDMIKEERVKGSMKTRIQELTCLRCDYQWVPRVVDVRQCPHCKTLRWDTPKKEKKDAQ